MKKVSTKCWKSSPKGINWVSFLLVLYAHFAPIFGSWPQLGTKAPKREKVSSKCPKNTNKHDPNGSATSPGVLCLGSAGSLAVPCLGSVCLVLTCSKRSKSTKGLDTTTQPPSAAGGGCAAAVAVSKPLPPWTPLLDLLEQVKTRQTKPRQGTASEPAEPAEPRQSTPGEVAEPSQATLSARTTTQPPSAAVRRLRRRSCCSCRECCLAWLCQFVCSALPWGGWLACRALPRLGLPYLDLL